jgi:D-alanyl-D-alanine carboxypeptidase/D-alanyl-D-alanine-endopeptidase (penicillin-binding protein 4)
MKGLLISILLFSFSIIATGQRKKVILSSFLSDSSVSMAHIGISIYDPEKEKYIYSYNSDKYFIPSSNTKLFTLYAGLKILGDSLPGLKVTEYEGHIEIAGTGDPTLLHPDFKQQPIFNFLLNEKKSITALLEPNPQFSAWAPGWVWDDYETDYMADRTSLPIFRNMISFSGTSDRIEFHPTEGIEVIKARGIKEDIIKRDLHKNFFSLSPNPRSKEKLYAPFITSQQLNYKMLADTLKKEINFSTSTSSENKEISSFIISSRPVDSLFIPMMYNSDNQFAEQTLLMASIIRLGKMSDSALINNLIKTDFAELPQQPRWIDGSGLSRYNLFTPNDLVFVLKKLKDDFGFERIKSILPSGGQGTLKNYFIANEPFIYAKTGTMSNNSCLSGYLQTRKGKWLIFSIMVNNYSGKAASVRKSIEKLLREIRETR